MSDPRRGPRATSWHGRWLLLAAAVAVGLLVPGVARAAPGLFVGVVDDSLEATPAETSAVANDLGLRAYSLSLRWTGGETTLSRSAADALGTAVRAAGGARLVVWIVGTGQQPPDAPDRREQYCSYVRDLLDRFPQIRDVVIWNEPNLLSWWAPQYGAGGASRAPALYEALLERCYDVLHAAHGDVDVIAPATSPWGNDDPFAPENVGHSPTSFILQVGKAYRASGRTRPIFDTLGHHPHPVSYSERPWLAHPDARFLTIGDLDRLVEVVSEAFAGTAQPIPGHGLPIWYLESGYQTIPSPAKRGLYTGTENWPGVLPDDAGGEPAQPPPAATSAAPDQATQLVDSIRLAYCQPYVQAIFNFGLHDERELGAWQSGVLWADGTRKGSYDAFKRVVAEVNAGTVDCTRMKGSVWTPAGAPQASRPAGARATPARTSVDRRTRTRLAWAARRPAPFGFVRLAARLTARGKPLAGRQVTFGYAGILFVTTTGKTGVARVPVARPLPPGAHVVNVTYRGSRTLAPAALKVLARVTNSRATIATATPKRQLTAARGRFRVSSDGTKVVGSLRLRIGGRTIVARRLRALGVAANGSSAWFAGTARGGGRFVGKVERTPRHGGDTLRLWLRGRALPLVRGLDVTLARRAR